MNIGLKYCCTFFCCEGGGGKEFARTPPALHMALVPVGTEVRVEMSNHLIQIGTQLYF